MSISREQLTQIIQEELSEVLGEAVGPTGRPYVRQTPSSLNPLIKNPVSGRPNISITGPVKPPVVRPPPPVNPPAVTTRPFVDPRIGTQKPFPTSPRVGAPGQYPLTQYAPKAPTNPNWTYGRGTGTGFRAPTSYPLARTGPTALSRVTSAAGGTTPHPIPSTQVVGGGLRGALGTAARAANVAGTAYLGHEIGKAVGRAGIGAVIGADKQAQYESDALASIAGMVRSDMTGDEALAMNQALRKMTVPGSAPNSPGGMWSPAQGHAFVNSVKNPKMKGKFMTALKDGTYQNIFMPQPAGFKGSAEESMYGAPAGSMTGVQLPQGPAAPIEVPAAQYDIVAGDTMGEIAKMHGTDVQTLLQLNPEIAAQDPRGNLIRVGQKVKLPTGTGAQTGVPRPRRWSGRAAAALDKRKESTPTDSGTSFSDIEAMNLDTPMTRREKRDANRRAMAIQAQQQGLDSKEVAARARRGQRFNPLKPSTYFD
tara:strand:+ start:1906 stop:3348 length:1443 start_codon:yes stop_codon:yes gene_type:complete